MSADIRPTINARYPPHMHDGDACTVTLGPTLDGKSRDGLKALTYALIADRTRTIRYDFAGVGAIDSNGIGGLITSARAARAVKVRTEAVNVAPEIGDLFELTNIDTLFDLMAITPLETSKLKLE